MHEKLLAYRSEWDETSKLTEKLIKYYKNTNIRYIVEN